jgi:hypothetical protein
MIFRCVCAIFGAMMTCSALEVSVQAINLGEIDAKTQAVPFQFTVTTSSEIKPTVETGCGCILAKVEPISGKVGSYSCSGEVVFGMMKGLMTKPVKVQSMEGGRKVYEEVSLRANVIPVGDVLPGSLLQWRISEQPIQPQKVTLLFSPSVKVKRITLSKQSDVYNVNASKKDQSGMSWEVVVRPKVMPKKPLVLPESIKLTIESDSPRVTEVVLFAMIDP